MHYKNIVTLRHKLYATLLVCCLLTCGATQAAADKVKTYTFQSDIVGKQLEYSVVEPDYFQPDQAYPLLITSAGERRLTVLTEVLGWLSHVGSGAAPQMLIMTIPDIPVETDIHPKYTHAAGVTHKKTLQMLKQEQLASLASHYKTTGFVVLDGYSTRAGFPLFVLANSADFADVYISSTPALALDESGILSSFSTLANNKQAHKNLASKSLFLSVGTFAENQHPMQTLKQTLSNISTTNFNFIWQDRGDENFLLPAMNDFIQALNTTFSDRHIDDYAASGINNKQDLINYYDKLSRKYKQNMNMDNALIDFAFYLAAQKRFDEAVSTVSELTRKQPENIYYLTRKAMIETEALRTGEAAKTLQIAKQLSEQHDNQDALRFVNQLISKLPDKQ